MTPKEQEVRDALLSNLANMDIITKPTQNGSDSGESYRMRQIVYKIINGLDL